MGWAFGIGLFGLGTYWLYTCLHIFGLVPIWLTLILQAVLVLVMAGYLAALCYLANRFWLKPNATRDWLVLPALWVLIEWLRGWLLSGFPWLSTGYALIDSPLAGWAPLLGVYGITWAAAALSVALNVLVLPGASRSRRALRVLGLPSHCWWFRHCCACMHGRGRRARRSPSPRCRVPFRRIKNGR